MRRAVVVTAAVAAMAGCGGDGVSREDFASEANAICSKQQDKVAALRPPRVLELFQDYFDGVLPIVRAQRDRVAALDAPKGDADTRGDLIERWSEVIGVLEDGRESAKSGSDVGIVITLRRAAAAERAADEAARALDLDDCVGFNPLTPR